MALADSLICFERSEAPDYVYALIEQAFSGDGRVEPMSAVGRAFRYHFDVPGGGSRINLTQTCAVALGVSKEDASCLSAAIECLHNASLVQDDMQDHSSFRRGQRSVVAVFGSGVALGLTDQLITTAFVCLSRVSRPEYLPKLIERLNGAVRETVDGQTCETEGKLADQDEAHYLGAAKRKSGPLFALSLELPLILADRSELLDEAHDAACHFGLGYQILDDLKDQEVDADDGSSGNIVLALRRRDNSDGAARDAAEIAEAVLKESVELAKKLPPGAGLALVELINQLVPQIDAFKS